MNNINEKQIYSTPIIEKIKLDFEISLALESIPPNGPGESMSCTPEYLNDPFKSNMV